jgi:phosphogluconate dehydratase
VTPLLARVYPNGSKDVNHFHAAGGMAFVVRELLDAGLAHADVMTVAGPGLRHYQTEPFLDDGALVWREGGETSLDADVLRPAADPFDRHGGINLVAGNLGRAVIKVSAVKPEHHVIEAPAKVFDDQDELQAAFKAGALTGDFIAVVRFQGPKANGMPELHNLSPVLGVLLDRGQKVALVTDGRMSGASGKTPAALHVTPEAMDGGALAYLRDGDMIRLDADAGVLEVKVDSAELLRRPAATKSPDGFGFGRELFAHMRRAVGPAEAGASVLF